MQFIIAIEIIRELFVSLGNVKMYFTKFITWTTNKNILTDPDRSKNHCLGFNYYKLFNAFKDLAFLQIRSEWITNKTKGSNAKLMAERIFPSLPDVLEMIPQ